jgi:hypothetical protein
MKDYYRILGVSRTAPASEIRRAYRRLVQQSHPDVNPDPEAQELIREINEAYEVLGDPQKRSDYDYRLDNPFSTIVVEQPPPHRDPAYRRRSYRPPRPTGPTQRDLMEGLMRHLVPVNWAGCVVVVFLCVDFFLPRHQVTETVTGFRSEPARRGWQDYVITDTGRELKISPDALLGLPAGMELVFVESRLLRILLRVHTRDQSLAISNLATLYGNFVFVPVLLSILSGLGLASLGGVEFRFSLVIVNAFVLIFTLILMFK